LILPETGMSSSHRFDREDYVTLASFRYALRQFLHFSAEAARTNGLSPQQHQALLAIKGFPERDSVTIGELAERLDLRHHSAVGLVDRLAKARLVRRIAGTSDKRKVHVRVTAHGEKLISRLSAAHRDELRRMEPELRRLLALIETAELKTPSKKKP
jgi:DNA-binding MarR family transcriptional regulator